MLTERDRIRYQLVPELKENAVLKLIIFTGILFVTLKFLVMLMIIYGRMGKEAYTIVHNQVGLGDTLYIKEYWWTPITSGWFHAKIRDWFINLIWLFAIGNALQMSVGYKIIFRQYAISSLVAGLAYWLMQFVVDASLPTPHLMGADAAILSFGVSVCLVNPTFKLPLSTHMAIPNWLLTTLFFIIGLLKYSFNIYYIAYLVAAILVGLICGQLYKKAKKLPA
jgi:membrane associated rhomboid family serine protease